MSDVNDLVGQIAAQHQRVTHLTPEEKAVLQDAEPMGLREWEGVFTLLGEIGARQHPSRGLRTEEDIQVIAAGKEEIRRLHNILVSRIPDSQFAQSLKDVF